MRDAWSYKLRCCWRHRAAEPRGLQSQSIYKCAAVGGTGLRSYEARGHSRCALRCHTFCAAVGSTELHRATGPAVTTYVLRADVGGTELQSFISCAMATPLRCCGRRRAAELYMACGYGDYATLLLAAEGCAATLPAAVASTLSYRGRRRAAGLHCLWLW